MICRKVLVSKFFLLMLIIGSLQTEPCKADQLGDYVGSAFSRFDTDTILMVALVNRPEQFMMLDAVNSGVKEVPDIRLSVTRPAATKVTIEQLQSMFVLDRFLECDRWVPVSEADESELAYSTAVVDIYCKNSIPFGSTATIIKPTDVPKIIYSSLLGIEHWVVFKNGTSRKVFL